MMPKSKKPNRDERKNAWILGGAQTRSQEKVSAYLAKYPMGLSSLSEAEFSDVMARIVTAMANMYSDGMSDTLDVLDGRDLTPIK